MNTQHTKDICAFLEHKAYNLRRLSIIQTTQAGSGHVTSCLSAADIMAVLFFYSMRFNIRDYEDPDNDRFILSKGHAAPVLYAAWEQLGVLSEQDILQYRSIHSVLEGHPTYRFVYAEAATGSLGMGMSIGVGEALYAKLDGRSYLTYVLMGDSETTEGSIWEAAFIAVYYKLDNFVGIIDCNRLGQSTETIVDSRVDWYREIFSAFGFNALVVDGHSVHELITVLDQARSFIGSGRPTMIIAKTRKGHGIDSVEDKEGFHGKAFKKEQLKDLLAQLEVKFPDAAEYDDNNTPKQLKMSYTLQNSSIADAHKSFTRPESSHDTGAVISLPVSEYEKGAMVATRKAYGQALTLLGDVCDDIVSLDAEVKNSTYAELFEQKHPKRFFQCFVAEQNMVAMGIGFSKRGKIPFISTFGCFFTRAHDQIRMAVLSSVPLRLVGSHVGVSIGQDGPSQMALEDIGMMRALPHSIVLYPCDAVSAYKLVEQMARYNQGISYMRTTRSETPVYYDNHESFVIGGCKVIRNSDKDQVCVIAAGITVWEALKAYDHLITQDASIAISIIDLYSIKPFDINTVLAVARKSGNKIITVEDHYIQGGIGEVVSAALCNTGIQVSCLAVTELPRSGKEDELLAWAKIDASAIINRVYALMAA